MLLDKGVTFIYFKYSAWWIIILYCNIVLHCVHCVELYILATKM